MRRRLACQPASRMARSRTQHRPRCIVVCVAPASCRPRGRIAGSAARAFTFVLRFSVSLCDPVPSVSSAARGDSAIIRAPRTHENTLAFCSPRLVCIALSMTTGASSVPIRAQKGHGRVAERDRLAHRRRRDQPPAATPSTPRSPRPSRSRSSHPTAGNIGGGGFIVYRPASGAAVTYDFREKAPAKASPTMWMKDGTVQQRAAPQQPPRGRRARDGGRPAPGLEGAGQAAVEAARRSRDRAGPRRLRGLRGARRAR